MEGMGDDKDAYGAAKASRFSFKPKSKSKAKRHRDDRDDRDDGDDGDDDFMRHGRSSKRPRLRKREDSRCPHRSHRHSTRRSKYESRTVHGYTFSRNGEYDNPDHRYRESLYDGLDDGETISPEALGNDPEQAFRESLFDALADDEGAAYWEGVYGQPVHIYSNTKKGPEGGLERMNDDEYAEYVRTKMWEKSHQHIMEEREARDRERRKRKVHKEDLEEEAAREEEEREHVRRRMQESLQRGEERKRAREAQAAWTTYLEKWEDLKTARDLAQVDEARVRDLIPWPVVSGKIKHVRKEDIEYFLAHSSGWKDDASAILKLERVRWHPDKMQQRFGQHLDDESMKLVTAVFQIVDKLWNERRKSS